MREFTEWLDKYHTKGMTTYQLWVEYQVCREWRFYGPYPTQHEAEKKYEQLFNDVDTPSIGGWYILKVEVIQ